MSSTLAIHTFRPGYLLNDYPEQRKSPPGALMRRAGAAGCWWRARVAHGGFGSIGRSTARRADEFYLMSGAQRAQNELKVRLALQERGWTRANLVDALALAGARVRHQRGFTLHPEQYFGAWVMLHGMLAEMATGEGKTIVAGITAVVAGLSGIPVHVITSNDYLVERDASGMRPLFESFGLSCGFICKDSDEAARREAYGCDVCYVSNKQLVFDYLRDRQSCGARPSTIAARIGTLSGRAARPPLLRGLCFGIVDEADSALIDDAITPLILSHQAESDDDAAQAVTALSLARRLQIDEHFTINTPARRVTLTPSGELHLQDVAEGLHGKWTNRRFRSELARQALAAIHLYRRDVDYLVQDGEVLLIDQATGRLMPDRKLQHGLHQIIETKEHCELSGATRTIASLSFQNFFVRYKHLCGMTGTAREAAGELRITYKLGVVAIPTHRPVQRGNLGTSFARDTDHYRELIVASVAERLERGQPVLIGTRSLAHSETLSGYLKGAGIDHHLLNARQDANESSIVARAGQRGEVTIATNMAGRGTDIPISDEVREAGGLHVIVSQLNESRRVERQLIGRCSRQGDPGSCELIVAADDETASLGKWPVRFAGSHVGRVLLERRARRNQRRVERRARLARAQVANSDRHMRKKLSYTGYKE